MFSEPSELKGQWLMWTTANGHDFVYPQVYPTNLTYLLTQLPLQILLTLLTLLTLTLLNVLTVLILQTLLTLLTLTLYRGCTARTSSKAT